MKRELKIKRCKKCGAIVHMIKDGEMSCCGEKMETVISNSVEAAVEKHIPTYEKMDDGIFVKVNHVMEKEHFIEWIALISENKEYFITLYPEQNAECHMSYIPGAKLYAYCNKHGLWETEVK